MKKKNPYTFTERMKRNAHNSYALAMIEIDPQDFLLLTIKSPSDLERIQNTAHKYQDYEKWGLDGEYVYPFLEIDEQGKIYGHEGRHRAWAAFVEKEPFHCLLFPTYSWKELKYEIKQIIMDGKGHTLLPESLMNQYKTNFSTQRFKIVK